MSLDLQSFDAALKQHYTSDTVEMMVYKDNPFLALVKKMEDFGGRNLPIPLIYGNPQGRSANFTNAQTRGQVLIRNLLTSFLFVLKITQLLQLITKHLKLLKVTLTLSWKPLLQKSMVQLTH